METHDFHMGPKLEKGQKLDKLTILSNICDNFHQKELFLAILAFLRNFSVISMNFEYFFLKNC